MLNSITIRWPYEIGEVVQYNELDSLPRLAKVISKQSHVPEGWGDDAGEMDYITLQFLDTQETREVTSSSAAWRCNMPLNTLVELSERLNTLGSNNAVTKEEMESIEKTLCYVDRLTSEAVSRNLELIGLPKDQFFVVLEEEFGYRSFLWFPEMDKATLIKWWQELETVEGDFMNPTNGLPGKVVEMQTAEEHTIWRALGNNVAIPYVHLFNDGDSILRADGQAYTHKGYDPHYYDPKPCDTVVETDGKGNIISQGVRQEHPCCGCPHHSECDRDDKEK
jgi:hypothetical protein